jgi:hypothetical protein
MGSVNSPETSVWPLKMGPVNSPETSVSNYPKPLITQKGKDLSETNQTADKQLQNLEFNVNDRERKLKAEVWPLVKFWLTFDRLKFGTL